MKWLALAVLLADFASTHLLGAGLLPGAGAESGLLFLFALGHCDTLDGPLATLGGKALAESNVNLVLPWVRPEDETEIRHAFEHAQAVRGLGAKARALADRHFLETLVRIHRAGEGAPFTGLKPAGLDLGPAVPAADQALKTGSPEALARLLADAVSAGLRERFRAAAEKRSFDPNDVAAGRRFVEAYVPYVHYVEKLWEAATGAAHSHSARHAVHPH